MRSMLAGRLARRSTLFALAILGSSALANPAGAAAPVLELPIDCKLGTTCFIQNYTDLDPSPGSRDYQCGTRTYDAHTGTDFRVRTMADQKQGVAVLASAPGRVAGIRDEMEDISVRERGLASVKNRECGNGVNIDHGDGWTTQYCHMARGSIRVKPGQQVVPGEKLGLVGLSGATEYPHVHLTVRKDGKVVDPFAYGAAPGACGGGASLWSPELAQALRYQPRAVLNAGFGTEVVTMAAIESGTAAVPVTQDSPALVAFVRAIGLKAGDVARITILQPGGATFVQNSAQPTETDQAQNMYVVGRKRPQGGYVPGEYKAVYEVLRDGAVALTHEFKLTMPK
jgi:hypothetical protein